MRASYLDHHLRDRRLDSNSSTVNINDHILPSLHHHCYAMIILIILQYRFFAYSMTSLIFFNEKARKGFVLFCEKNLTADLLVDYKNLRAEWRKERRQVAADRSIVAARPMLPCCTLDRLPMEWSIELSIELSHSNGPSNGASSLPSNGPIECTHRMVPLNVPLNGPIECPIEWSYRMSH